MSHRIRLTNSGYARSGSDLDTEHKPCHVAHLRIIRLGRYGVVRFQVNCKMTVEDPVARPVRRPGDRHGRQWRHQLRNDVLSWLRPALVVGQRAGECIDTEIESVQVHRMYLAGCVDDSPVKRVTHCRVYPICVRPRATVDREYNAPGFPRCYADLRVRRVFIRGEGRVERLHDHEYTVMRRLALRRRVDHDRAG